MTALGRADAIRIRQSARRAFDRSGDRSVDDQTRMEFRRVTGNKLVAPIPERARPPNQLLFFEIQKAVIDGRLDWLATQSLDAADKIKARAGRRRSVTEDLTEMLDRMLTASGDGRRS